MIDLDRNWGDQSHLAVAVGARLFKEFGIARPNVLWEVNARDVLDVVKDRYARNIFLAKQGIWLLRVHLDAIEDGGLGDRGCQFLLLDASRVKKLTAL